MRSLILLLAFFISPLYGEEIKGHVLVAAGPFIVIDTGISEVIVYLPDTASLADFLAASELTKGETILVETSGKSRGVETAAVVVRRPLLSIDPGYTILARDVETMRNKKGLIVLDARSADHFSAGHLPGALSLPVMMFTPDHAVLPAGKETPLVVYGSDARDESSHRLLRLLTAQGYSDVRILVDGLEGWKVGWDSHRQHIEMEPKFLASLVARQVPVAIVDVRDISGEKQTSLPGAARIPFDQLTFRFFKDLVSTLPVIFVGETADDPSARLAAEKALPWLTRGPAWARHPVFVLTGGMAGWKEAGGSVVPTGEATIHYRPDPSVPELDPEELQTYWNRRGHGVTFIDVRFLGVEPEEGLLHCPLESFLTVLDTLPRDGLYIIFCQAGERARIAAEIMNRNGYSALFTRLQPPLP
ncbi:MAG TPA: rhodanese-like domain-containing protein [Thermoanaerobaculia bacterium]|nr:rhodanese-like domain-containing protein [Thermoanaerobaculia bacterium]HUM29119.1 rhodanese-like domain-containing protein [Thermoanaerobaculia bacterium]HXK67496.1 rhodanese-like domain-containing protein [Thermoanaerobaculia bacterium]